MQLPITPISRQLSTAPKWSSTVQCAVTMGNSEHLSSAGSTHHFTTVVHTVGTNHNDSIVACTGMLSNAVGSCEHPHGIDEDPSTGVDMAMCLDGNHVREAALWGIHTTLLKMTSRTTCERWGHIGHLKAAMTGQKYMHRCKKARNTTAEAGRWLFRSQDTHGNFPRFQSWTCGQGQELMVNHHKMQYMFHMNHMHNNVGRARYRPSKFSCLVLCQKNLLSSKLSPSYQHNMKSQEVHQP